MDRPKNEVVVSTGHKRRKPGNTGLFHPSDLAHYSKATIDIMYKFPHGLEELEGIANRTDFDLGSHTKGQKDFDIQAKVSKNNHSNSKLAVQDINTKKWKIPYVIEPSAGVDRGVLALLNEAYKIETLREWKRKNSAFL